MFDSDRRETAMSVLDKKEELIAAGIDVDSVLQRFMGSEKLMEKFLKRFLDDVTFGQLCDSIAANDCDGAFRAAHTLKGVAGNLGMTELFDCVSAMTEKFRAQDMSSAASDLEGLRKVYEKVLEAVKKLS